MKGLIIINNSRVVEDCYKVSAYNDAAVSTRWKLRTLDGKVLHESSLYAASQRWEFSLSILSIPPGYQLELYAAVGGKDSVSTVVLQYEPESFGTSYFILDGSAFSTDLKYLGTDILIL